MSAPVRPIRRDDPLRDVRRALSAHLVGAAVLSAVCIPIALAVGSAVLWAVLAVTATAFGVFVHLFGYRRVPGSSVDAALREAAFRDSAFRDGVRRGPDGVAGSRQAPAGSRAHLRLVSGGHGS